MAPRQGTGEEPTERLRLGPAGLRQRMAMVRRNGPVDHALAAGLLSADVAGAYRSALFSRDRAAKVLHDEYGWSCYALAGVIYGDGSQADRVRRAIAARSHHIAPERLIRNRPSADNDRLAPADLIGSGGAAPAAAVEAEWALREAHRQAVDLRALLTDSRRLAAAHFRGREDPEGGAAHFGLPDEPQSRLRAVAGQLRLVDLYRVSLIAARNLAAAELVENAGWPLPEVAALARTAPSAIVEARWAATAQPAGHADPATVVELSELLDALAGRAQALGDRRDETIRALVRSGVSPGLVAALGQIPREHVASLSTMEMLAPI